MSWLFRKFRNIFYKHGANKTPLGNPLDDGFEGLLANMTESGNMTRAAMHNFQVDLRNTVLGETGRTRLTVSELKHLHRLALTRWGNLPEDMKQHYRSLGQNPADAEGAPNEAAGAAANDAAAAANDATNDATNEATNEAANEATNDATNDVNAAAVAATADDGNNEELPEPEQPGPQTRSRTQRRNRPMIEPRTLRAAVPIAVYSHVPMSENGIGLYQDDSEEMLPQTESAELETQSMVIERARPNTRSQSRYKKSEAVASLRSHPQGRPRKRQRSHVPDESTEETTMEDDHNNDDDDAPPLPMQTRSRRRKQPPADDRVATRSTRATRLRNAASNPAKKQRFNVQRHRAMFKEPPFQFINTKVMDLTFQQALNDEQMNTDAIENVKPLLMILMNQTE